MNDVAQLLESRRSRLGRWAAAALIVCALHTGGAALALMYWQEAEDADDPAGALTVELTALPAAAAPVDSPDVAHGPEQQQAKLTPEAAKPVVEEEANDIPLVEPSAAPEPEVALPKPQPEEKEKPKEQEEPQEAAPQEPTPQQDADVPVTTAPPRVEAQPAPRPAPLKGMSRSYASAMASWENALTRQLNRHKRVPEAALRQRGQWEAVVAFTVDRSGQLISSELRKSTGVPALDREALEWLQRASPFPPPPDIPGIELYFTQSIKFGVK
jgi:periplasmic protein TonB